MPQTPTQAAFITSGVVELGSDSFATVASKQVPGGSYAVIATADTRTTEPGTSSNVRDVWCEVLSRSNGTGPANVIGGTRDRRQRPAATPSPGRSR